MSGLDEKPIIIPEETWLEQQNREISETMKQDIWKNFKKNTLVSILCFLINVILGIVYLLTDSMVWIISFSFGSFFLLSILFDYRNKQEEIKSVDDMFSVVRIVST